MIDFSSLQNLSEFDLCIEDELVVVDFEAHYILIVEKEGIFNRLVEDKLHHRLPVIIICGKGYPDLLTRR